MTSRRFPSRRLPYDDTGTIQTPDGNDGGEVDNYIEESQPNCVFGTDTTGFQKTARPQIARAQHAPVSHPKLTTFGPNSLQEFLKTSLERQCHEQLAAEHDSKIAELHAMRQRAMLLVKASVNLVVVGERGKKDFKLETPSPRQRRSKQRTQNLVDCYGSEDEACTSSPRPKRRTSNIKTTSGDLASPKLGFQDSLRIAPSSKRKSTNDLNAAPPVRRRSHKEQLSTSLGQQTPNSKVAASVASSASGQCGSSRHPRQSNSLHRRGQSQPSIRHNIGTIRTDEHDDLPDVMQGAENNRFVCNETISASLMSSYSTASTPHSYHRRHSQPIQALEDLAQLSASCRSLSFEKHANEQRKHRRLGRSTSLMSSDGSRGKQRADKMSQRPRKVQSGNVPISSLDANTLTADVSSVSEQSQNTSNSPLSEMKGTSLGESECVADFQDFDVHNEVTLPEGHLQRLDKDTFLTGSSDECESEKGLETSLMERLGTTADEQRMILSSLAEARDRASNSNEAFSLYHCFDFDYSKIVPEQLPNDLHQAERNRRKIWQAHGLDADGRSDGKITRQSNANVFPLDTLDPTKANILSAPDEFGDYDRKWFYKEPPPTTRSPPFCPPPAVPRTSLPTEIWEEGVLDYLSSTEVRNLRFVCKSVADDLAPYVFRNVVTKFGRHMFNIHADDSGKSFREHPTSGSMFNKYGKEINKFGISFEVNELGLTYAPNKVTEKLVHTWYGDYKWPVKDYPYFPSLKEMDDLLDDERHLLTQSLKKLAGCSELGLCIDSGHGWLSGPDVSDMQLYKHLASGGSKVFGKSFSAEDKWHAFALREYFKWAQMNSINENLKRLHQMGDQHGQEEQILRSIVIRGYDSYLVQSRQPDFERYAHVGGKPGNGTTVANPQNNQNPPVLPQGVQQLAPAPQAGLNNVPTHPGFTNLNVNGQPIPLMPLTNTPNDDSAGLRVAHLLAERQMTSKAKPPRKQDPIQPQWPIIFNGYNLSAESRGHCRHIQERVSNPAANPLHPGRLEEAQAQWLLETSWIQRTFLSAYTDAVRLNSQALRGVHSLHISKISSGLLQSLAQHTFWSSLPGLRKVTILVKPDWREEHIPGDKFWHRNMAIAPFAASLKFAEILQNYIGRLENLYTLTIGFTSGGEHQVGLFGRNQHVLPAPVTLDPFAWLTEHKAKPDNSTIFSFNHIRTLKFENCWFSPSMLRAFMTKSKDSSLHHLILDSVSLTGTNSNRTDGPLQTVIHSLKCDYSPSEWLQEIVPASACWVHVLDSVTPGKTLLDRKYDADMIDAKEQPKPETGFRGNVQRITLNSCGYVKISGVSSNDFNQNSVVVQNSLWASMDEGLRIRMSGFRARACLPTDTTDTVSARRSSRANDITELLNIRDTTWHHIMLSGRSDHNDSNASNVANNTERGERSIHNLYLLGKLTQCVHPVEKRILEHAWGMRFGWGDTMERWDSVDDGYFEGGTGRFSGEISATDTFDFRDEAPNRKSTGISSTND